MASSNGIFNGIWQWQWPPASPPSIWSAIRLDLPSNLFFLIGLLLMPKRIGLHFYLRPLAQRIEVVVFLHLHRHAAVIIGAKERAKARRRLLVDVAYTYLTSVATP